MELLKLVLTLSLAVGSLAYLRLSYGRTWELTSHRRLVLCGTAAKIACLLLIYIMKPSLVGASDAKLYYYPQVTRLLAGELPYRDFASSYSPLFAPLLALPVYLWRSVGAIALTMFAFETAMLAIYLRRQRVRDPALGWRTAFLYCFSPISWYWVALTGYNGAIISALVMLSLVLAERGRDQMAGLAAAGSFLFCKLLALLAWPAVVLFAARGRMARLAWPAAALATTAGLTLLGINSLSPIARELPWRSSGNLWFLLCPSPPPGQNSIVWALLSAASFACCLGLAIRAQMRCRPADGSEQFDRAVALVAVANLLYMALSRKSFTFYMPMCLVFVLHTVVANGGRLWVRLGIIAFLGATTTIEPHLFGIFVASHHPLMDSAAATCALWLLDAITVAGYLYLAASCIAPRSRPSSGDEVRLPASDEQAALLTH